MNTIPFFGAAALLGLTLAGCARAADPPGVTILTTDPAGQAKGDYQPLISADLPKTGDAWTVWARVRGAAVQLKGVDAAGKQTDLDWAWDKPADWTWVRLGRHSRAELGARVLVIRGPGAAADAGLDRLAFAEDAALTPDRLPQPILPPVTVQIHWDQTVAQAGPLSYGLNAFQAFDPASGNNAAYRANLAYLKPGLIRFHNWGMMGDSAKSANGWIDAAHQTWDAAKIRRVVAAYPDSGGAILINIPAWPSWMDKDHDGFLDADQKDAFAAFCADLVQIINADGRHRARYWEVPNERDGLYYGDFHQSGGAGPLKDPTKPDRTEELADIFTRCARAMKAADPAIRVGGPAMARPDYADFARRFVRRAGRDLDFFSVHAYASGAASDSDGQIFDTAQGMGWTARGLRQIIREESPKRAIPVFLDEYNISWSWETRDPRMTDAKSAVFDALVIADAVRNGAAATTAWNEKDGIYGKTDNADHRRPAATLFHWLNADFIGPVVEASSDAPNAVVPYAVQTPQGRALLLINRTDHARTVMLPALGKAIRRGVIAPAGVTEPQPAPAGPLDLPADSVTVILSKP